MNKTDQIRLFGNSAFLDEEEAFVGTSAADIIELHQRIAA